jgi:peroxiredoxin
MARSPSSRATKVGQTAPSFALPDASGVTTHSDEYLQRGALVISFYRGLWCPYCNIELEALQETVADIRATGAELVVISPQTAANSRRSARVGRLNFQLLIDKGNEVAAEFGLRCPRISSNYTRHSAITWPSSMAMIVGRYRCRHGLLSIPAGSSSMPRLTRITPFGPIREIFYRYLK